MPVIYVCRFASVMQKQVTIYGPNIRRKGPSISVPNLKRIAQFVQTLLRGPKNGKLGRDPGHAHLWSFYDPYAGRVRPLCLYQISSG